MTAVIGIINKSAAAIATDSAVTVTGPKGPKIFNRANKIFNISKCHPIGLMIYNQGEFMGTPWEIIIKEYRKGLGTTCFNTVEDYKNNFLEFLHSRTFFCDSQQQKKMLHFLLIDVLNYHFQQTLLELQPVIQSPPPNLREIIAQHITNKISIVASTLETNTEFNNEFHDSSYEEFEQLNFTEIATVLQHVIISQGIPINTAALQPIIKNLLFHLLKAKQFYNFFSGLVFVGYGNMEIFPSIIPINISLALGTRLRWYDEQNKKAVISHSQSQRD